MKKKVNKKEKIVRKSFFEKYWIPLVLIGFVLLFVAFYYIFSGYNTITYETLTFEKENWGGGLIFYHYAYYFSDETGQVYRNNIYLRTNPYKNKVPVNDKISFEGRKIDIGIDNLGLNNCNDSMIAVGTLGAFFQNNMFKVDFGNLNKEDAIEKNQTFVECGMTEYNVVELSQGEKTEIYKKANNCYVISVNQCEILPAVEKFVLESLVNAKNKN